MNNEYAVLPCNGLDKCAGSASKEIAIRLCEATSSEIICPVFYRVADARYSKLAKEKPLLVIDGCQTRCASKLAAEKELKIVRKIMVAEEAKKRNVELPGDTLRLDNAAIELCQILVNEILQETKEEKVQQSVEQTAVFTVPSEYEVFTKDKFIFRIPKEGFYFNENDSWVQVVGNKSRIGVTDYVQQSLSDIMFFTPPTVGSEVEQFGDLGSVESGKAVFDLVCPVTGKVTAVNEELLSSPEFINQNPYEQGWIAEVELSDFDEDSSFLLDFAGYYKVLKKKVEEFHVK